jgi:hypothetical protein
MRLLGASSSSSDEDDGDKERQGFLWLDKLNLFLLVAVVAGILNSERGLLASLGGGGGGGGCECLPGDA